jgi:putative hydrolase of the HAD superfamily
VPAAEAYATLRRARALHGPGLELQVLCERHGLDGSLVADLIAVSRAHRPQLWLAHDARAALERLRASGWGVAVLTNGDPRAQAMKVRALALHALVDHVVYAEEHAAGGKPARAAFAEALCRLQAPPDETVMVGDDPVNDVEGGRAAGLRTIHLSRPGGPDARGLADASATRLADVPEIAAALVRWEVRRAA